mmetsp:Transcript_7745/g.19886  ORF Transcript_7745/g.19886 Transcript_7745/m.19886 type:complete len:91 (-) Transcript_7745:552-824(-)
MESLFFSFGALCFSSLIDEYNALGARRAFIRVVRGRLYLAHCSICYYLKGLGSIFSCESLPTLSQAAIALSLSRSVAQRSRYCSTPPITF